MIQQWFDNDCLIIQLAWLIFRQWFNVTLIIHSSSQSSSINLLAWLFIRVIDYSTMIRQWLFYQPARVMNYSTMIESHWLVVIIHQLIKLITHLSSQSSSINQSARLIIRVTYYSTMTDCHIEYSFEESIEFSQPTCMIDYSGDWLFNNDSTMIV